MKRLLLRFLRGTTFGKKPGMTVAEARREKKVKDGSAERGGEQRHGKRKSQQSEQWKTADRMDEERG
jgi:hypothetical protein